MDLTARPRARLCVGSYSESVPHAVDAHGHELQIVDVDLATGDQVVRFQSQGLVNPAFVAVHPTLPVLYAVCESWTAPGVVASLRFSPEFTELVSRTELRTDGNIPSYVAVTGSFLALSNYGDGSLVVYRLGADGDLVEQTAFMALAGSGPDADRQDGPHTHCVIPHPTNGFLYAADLGADLMLRLVLDSATGRLSIAQELYVPPGSGPRHLVFSPAGDTVFLVEELTSTLAVFDVDPAGDLVLRQRLSMLPADVEVSSFGADIVMTPGGDRIFASNRGHNSVVTFAPAAAGLWCAVGWTPTGDIPRGLTLTPDRGHLLVANQGSDTIDVLKITASGLVPALRFTSATPTCLRVVLAPDLALARSPTRD